ncbi:response regulator transcription factor [Meiothermus sp.]|jgi:DNA-binding response OmpR family regulator|uniref:response regulator transcription factor n=1 Tax=Meiothermus sp. TaxID=1955249 RepID=UPI0021DD6DC5|nr:response regulator transcription factor [Meiothermus sp.]GIW24355.1 MAG: DNA-binding response regulator [Meiothermus sp.]
MRILLVEDETDLARLLTKLLNRERHQVEWARSQLEAYAKLEALEPDLVILDVMLPEGDAAGFSFAEQLRQGGYSGAILFLTARDALEDRVTGLDLGGDDYLIKPFELEELLARVRALLRRGTPTRSNFLDRGSLRVDFTNRKVLWDNREVDLTPKEFALIELLALYPERVYTVDELLTQLFPNAASGHHILRMYVKRLREKMQPEVIKTIPGGYRLGLS